MKISKKHLKHCNFVPAYNEQGEVKSVSIKGKDGVPLVYGSLSKKHFNDDAWELVLKTLKEYDHGTVSTS